MTDAEYRQIFAVRLKEVLSLQGVTQVELATELDVSKATVNKYTMAIALPSIPSLIKIAKILGCTTDYLLGLDDTKPVQMDYRVGKTASELEYIKRRLAHIERFLNIQEDMDDIPLNE